MTEETKRKISESMKKAWREGRKQGKSCSTETKDKLSKSLSKKWENGQYKSLKGNKLSDQHKKKISLAIKKRWTDKNYKDKKINDSRLYWSSNDNRKKCSEQAIKRWSEHEYREMTLAAIRRATSNVEYKQLQKKIGLSKSVMISIFMKNLWEDETYRIKMTKIINDNMNSVETKQKISNNSKKHWKKDKYRTNALSHLDEIRKKPQRLFNLRKAMKTNDYLLKTLVATREAMQRPDVLKKLSEAALRNWDKQDYRDKMMLIKSAGQKKPTNIELALEQILRSFGIQYYMQTFVGRHEFDFVIPSHNLIIEVHGDFWHRLPRKISADKGRATYINKYYPRFNIYYVWEHEFFCIERVRNRVASILNIRENQIDFNFKDLKIKEIGFSEAKDFVSSFHYLGAIGKGGTSFGIYLDDLIGVIHFSGVSRREIASSMGMKTTNVLELSRLVFHPRYQKKNLASWFISRTISLIRKKYDSVTKLVSFSDMTYNHSGIIYKASNWKQISVVDSDYWYVDEDGYRMHKKTLYNRARKMSLKENEFAKDYGYKKIWGNIKYKFTYDLRKENGRAE